MFTPINEASTPAPAGTVPVPDTPYTPLPGDEKADIPPQELADEKKAETVELPLTRDDKEAIDTSNIIGERTRHARPLSGTYEMPGDEEGLPMEVVEVKASGSADEDMDGSVDGNVSEGVDEDMDENGDKNVDQAKDGDVDMVEAGEVSKDVEGEGEKGKDAKLDEEVKGSVDAEMNAGMNAGMDGQTDEEVDEAMGMGVATIK
ncbi:hypothetical protein F4806DRAFT_502904 [Annulohypoxylon nitens]|nr:hypothetical protein F4806DRAFT_502904 [Annulohypoxylon nitens]